MSSLEHSTLLASRKKHYGAIELVDIIQKNRNVHCPWFGHHVVIDPGATVLMPLPNITSKCHFSINFELVHVELFTNHLPTGFTILVWGLVWQTVRYKGAPQS